MKQMEMKSGVSATFPMVSVVMVAYNAEKYIREAIAGVVRQKVGFEVELLLFSSLLRIEKFIV